MKTNKDKSGTFRRILFCTDFSENADIAFEHAVKQAQCSPGSQFFLLHVIPEPDAQFWKTYLYEVDDVDSKARHDIDEKIDKAYKSKLPDDMELWVTFRVGTDHEEILRYAEEIDADLLVIGRQGKSSIGKMLFGNVTEKIVRKASCSVLMVPQSSDK